MPDVDDLLVDDQRPGPLDGTHPDQQDRQAKGEPEQHVLEVGVEGSEVDRRIARHREVDHHERDAEDRHQTEHGGDLAGRPVGRRLVDVGQPGEMVLHPGIGNRKAVRIRRDGEIAVRGALELGPTLVRVVAHRAFAPLAAIQIPKQMTVPRPRIQAHRPSLTGPRPPRAR